MLFREYLCVLMRKCKSDNFSLQNIHEHQFRFMTDFEKQDGIAFILLYFTHRDEKYYIPYRDIKKFMERANENGRKHIKYDEIDKSYLIGRKGGVLVHYLEQLQKDLASRG